MQIFRHFVCFNFKENVQTSKPSPKSQGLKIKLFIQFNLQFPFKVAGVVNIKLDFTN